MWCLYFVIYSQGFFLGTFLNLDKLVLIRNSEFLKNLLEFLKNLLSFTSVSLSFIRFFTKLATFAKNSVLLGSFFAVKGEKAYTFSKGCSIISKLCNRIMVFWSIKFGKLSFANFFAWVLLIFAWVLRKIEFCSPWVLSRTHKKKPV